jgi:hypothetical protein
MAILECCEQKPAAARYAKRAGRCAGIGCYAAHFLHDRGRNCLPLRFHDGHIGERALCENRGIAAYGAGLKRPAPFSTSDAARQEAQGANTTVRTIVEKTSGT